MKKREGKGKQKESKNNPCHEENFKKYFINLIKCII